MRQIFESKINILLIPGQRIEIVKMSFINVTIKFKIISYLIIKILLFLYYCFRSREYTCTHMDVYID